MSNNNRRGHTPANVVVVKKKKFSFSKKVEEKNIVDTEEVIEKKEIKQERKPIIQDLSYDLVTREVSSGSNDFKNLDDDYKKKEAEVEEKVGDEEKSKKKSFKKVKPVIKKEDKNNGISEAEKAEMIFAKKLGSYTSRVKEKKNILSDLTIISHSKDKEYNNNSDSSLFLSGKERHQDRKRGHIYDDSEEERIRSIASIKRAREKSRGTIISNKDKTEKSITIPEIITVQELANRMAMRSADIVKELMKMGMMITATKPIDADTAEIIATELGYVVSRVSESDVEKVLENSEKNNAEKLIARSPVVAVMGHVDHGKTSLLDALRETDIVSKESGGITQYIGASKIKIDKNHSITFLDTPGHEAFTEMRLRGANVTDLVILVVAADDGIKEQTIEAINHARIAEVPIIVAINKIDKEGANSKKILGALLEHNVVTEEMGGDVLAIEVSALKKTNLKKLEEAILLQAELLDLKANPECKAEGIVIESRVDKSKGVLASVIVRHGTLKVSDIIASGTAYGKVRKLTNDKGHIVHNAKPSDVAEILGLDIAPEAGDKFYVVESEKIARDLIEYRINKKRDKKVAESSKKTLEDIFADMTGRKTKEVSLIIKGDVKGSCEAISSSLQKLSGDEVKVKIIHSAVGGITDSDLSLARASDAVIIAFNVRLSNYSKDKGEIKDVDIRYYSIIYNVIDDIKAIVTGMLSPIYKNIELGKGVIRDVITLSKYGNIAGSYINSGLVRKSGKCRIIRDAIVIVETDIKALKHYKEDKQEVKSGLECGISFENFTDFKVADQLEFFEVVEEKRKPV